MTVIKKSRKLIIGLASVTVMLGGTYLWSYAATSCTCFDFKDMDAYIKKQVVQQNEYKIQKQIFRIIEEDVGRYGYTYDRGQIMMQDIKKAIDANYDYTGVQTVGAETSGVTCAVETYEWVDSSGFVHNGYPNLCLKELVDVHEQVHIDECKRINSSWNYLSSKIMEEVAAEEIKATQAGMDNTIKLKDAIERQFCCSKGQVSAPSLKTIIANLFTAHKGQ